MGRPSALQGPGTIGSWARGSEPEVHEQADWETGGQRPGCQGQMQRRESVVRMLRDQRFGVQEVGPQDQGTTHSGDRARGSGMMGSRRGLVPGARDQGTLGKGTCGQGLGDQGMVSKGIRGEVTQRYIVRHNNASPNSRAKPSKCSYVLRVLD